MDDKENIKVTINQNPIEYNKTDQNIYHHIENVKINSNKNEIIKNNTKKETYNLNKYISASITSVLIYIVCIMTAQIPIANVITVEVPLIILLSLILTNLIESNHTKEGYCGYLILAILLFGLGGSYTFLMLVTVLSQSIIDCIIKIFTNKHDYSIHEEKSEKTTKKQTIINYFHRIKYHILLSVILFVSFTIIAYFYPTVFQSIMVPAYQGMQEGAKNGTVELATTPLFVNNFSVALRMFISGLCLSIPNAYLLIYNALLIGFTGAQLPIVYFLSFTLPHGILELTAIMLAGAAGFRVTQALLTILSMFKAKREASQYTYLKNGLKMVFDSLIIMVIVLILLIIAAYVEANLTIPIGKTILGV